MHPRQIATRLAALTAAILMLSVEYSAAAPALATSNVNLRNGPGTTYTVVMTIPGGSNLDVNSCNAGWCQVTYQGQNGYVIATSIDQGGSAPPGAPPPPGMAGPPGPPPGALGPPGPLPPGAPPPSPGAYSDLPIPVAPGAPPPGYAGPPPVVVVPPPYYYGYGRYYYGYGPYYGWRGGYGHRHW